MNRVPDISLLKKRKERKRDFKNSSYLGPLWEKQTQYRIVKLNLSENIDHVLLILIKSEQQKCTQLKVIKLLSLNIHIKK